MSAWLAACAVLAGGAAAVGLLSGDWSDATGHPLAWSATGWPLEPWTVWTASWVHATGSMVLANLLALGALAVLGAALKAGRPAALALLLAWPVSTLALLIWPVVRGYSGMGGVIHAAAMVLWAHALLHGLWRPLSFVLFAGVGLKLLAEQAWVNPVTFDPAWGVNVVPAGNLTGAISGAVLGLVVGALAMRRGKPAAGVL